MKLKRVAKIVLCLALLFVMGGECLLSPFLVKAEANTSKYSNVLDDLKKDKTFSAENYPLDGTRNDLQIIQVAEGNNQELFIYVYQPGYETKDYSARFVVMGFDDFLNKNPNYDSYSLTLINKSQQFAKYLVNGVNVKSDEFRYYNIISVLRDFDSNVDEQSELVDGYKCKSFPVGSLWTASTYNGEVIYKHENIEIVDIDIFASGSVQYKNGFHFYVSRCDAFYIGFNIENYDADRIIDADVKFSYHKETKKSIAGLFPQVEVGDQYTVYRLLSENDKASTVGSSIVSGKKYSWNRIQTGIEFAQYLKSQDVVDSSVDDLQNCQFIFNYFESSHTYESGLDGEKEKYFVVDEIMVLRLHFVVDNVHYNLGCVSDIVSADGDPEFVADDKDDWLDVIIGLFLILIFVCILAPIVGPMIPLLCKMLFNGLLFFLKAIFTLLLVPWNLLFTQKKKK